MKEKNTPCLRSGLWSSHRPLIPLTSLWVNLSYSISIFSLATEKSITYWDRACDWLPVGLWSWCGLEIFLEGKETSVWVNHSSIQFITWPRSQPSESSSNSVTIETGAASPLNRSPFVLSTSPQGMNNCIHIYLQALVKWKMCWQVFRF